LSVYAAPDVRLQIWFTPHVLKEVACPANASLMAGCKADYTCNNTSPYHQHCLLAPLPPGGHEAEPLPGQSPLQGPQVSLNGDRGSAAVCTLPGTPLGRDPMCSQSRVPGLASYP
jgi:hypothetical protein